MAARGNEYRKGLRAYKMGDYVVAYRILIRFAEGGDAEARVAVGTMYQLGLGGVEIDESKAAKWYRLASTQGNGLASNNLGTLALLRGDRKAATQWFLKAHDQGFRHSPLLPLPKDRD